MSAAALLERLQGVRSCGNGRYRAICPAHESKRATKSLAVRELGDGTVLLHCFAGCGSADVLAAAGLAFSDLFPREHKAPDQPRPAQRPGHWHARREALQTVAHECLLVAIAADDIATGRGISSGDAERVATAAGRIRSAIEACI